MSKKKFMNFFSRFHHPNNRYAPWYDEHADYNTNAKSYYDYLARKNRFMGIMEDFINRLLRRDIKFNDTNSVKFNKQGDWIDNGECEPEHYDDILNIKADVKISSQTETKTYTNITPKTVNVPNGTVIKSDGLYSPDYANVLTGIDNELGKIKGDITNLDNRVTKNEGDIIALNSDVNNLKNRMTTVENNVTNLTNGLQKIVNNLHTSGAITSNNINNFTFKTGRNIASGNINLFGGTQDGTSFIRTSDNKTSNDISAGY